MTTKEYALKEILRQIDDLPQTDDARSLINKAMGLLQDEPLVETPMDTIIRRRMDW